MNPKPLLDLALVVTGGVLACIGCNPDKTRDKTS